MNAAAGSPVRVSQAFVDMLALALDAARETDGLVDPRVGGALEAAGYDRDFSALEADRDRRTTPTLQRSRCASPAGSCSSRPGSGSI